MRKFSHAITHFIIYLSLTHVITSCKRGGDDNDVSSTKSVYDYQNVEDLDLNLLSAQHKKLIIAFSPLEDHYHRIIVADTQYDPAYISTDPYTPTQEIFDEQLAGTKGLYTCHAHYDYTKSLQDPRKYCVPAYNGNYSLPKSHQTGISLPETPPSQSIFAADNPYHDLTKASSPRQSPRLNRLALSSPPLQKPSAAILAAEQLAFAGQSPSTVIIAESYLPTDILIWVKPVGDSYQLQALYDPYPDTNNTTAHLFVAAPETRLQAHKYLQQLSLDPYSSEQEVITQIIQKIDQLGQILNLNINTSVRKTALVWGSQAYATAEYLLPFYDSKVMNWYNSQPVAVILPILSRILLGHHHPVLVHASHLNEGMLYQSKHNSSQLPGLFNEATQAHEAFVHYQQDRTLNTAVWLHKKDHVQRWNHLHPRFHLSADGTAVRFRPSPAHSSDNPAKILIGTGGAPISAEKLLTPAQQECLKTAYVKQLACQGKRPD